MNSHGGKIVVDLDGVLFSEKKTTYEDCKVNTALANRLRELKNLGFAVAIHSSRNVRTHDSNLGKLTADTAQSISKILAMHDIPYDELWVGKPWPGKTGVYVDDRAISPSQFLNLTAGELLSMVRSQAFGYNNPTPQNWVIQFSQAGQSSLLINKRIHTLAAAARETGYRTVLVLNQTSRVPAAVRRELRALGVIIHHESTFHHPLRDVVDYLVDNELASAKSVIIFPEPGYIIKAIPQVEDLGVDDRKDSYANYISIQDFHQITADPTLKTHFATTSAISCVSVNDVHEIEKSRAVLKSRHFNHVLAIDDKIVKTSFDPVMRNKLALECTWLKLNEELSPGGIEPIPGGYKLNRAEGGDLATLLNRGPNVSSILIKSRLKDLVSKLHKPVAYRQSDITKMREDHQQLIVEKSKKRVEQYDNTLKEQRLLGLGVPWVINDLGPIVPKLLIGKIIDEIPLPEASHYVKLHGDLCPGNIVLDEEMNMFLIDPRATLDGMTLAMHGDGRYDLAKLSHALNFGYDAVLENWYECSSAVTNIDKVSDILGVRVDVSLHDEHPSNAAPKRRTIWNALKDDIQLGSTALGSHEIQLIAALQLITCAPLHSDDPKRALALFSLGLQAGIKTLSAMGKM